MSLSQELSTDPKSVHSRLRTTYRLLIETSSWLNHLRSYFCWEYTLTCVSSFVESCCFGQGRTHAAAVSPRHVGNVISLCSLMYKTRISKREYVVAKIQINFFNSNMLNGLLKRLNPSLSSFLNCGIIIRHNTKSRLQSIFSQNYWIRCKNFYFVQFCATKHISRLDLCRSTFKDVWAWRNGPYPVS